MVAETDPKSVYIPMTVCKQMKKIQMSGLTNMYNRGNVREIGVFCGYVELVEWIEDDDTEYMDLLTTYVKKVPDDYNPPADAVMGDVDMEKLMRGDNEDILKQYLS
mgnify:CR=1 FL=1